MQEHLHTTYLIATLAGVAFLEGIRRWRKLNEKYAPVPTKVQMKVGRQPEAVLPVVVAVLPKAEAPKVAVKSMPIFKERTLLDDVDVEPVAPRASAAEKLDAGFKEIHREVDGIFTNFFDWNIGKPHNPA